MIFGEYRRSDRPGFGDGLISISESGALTRHIPADVIRHWRNDRAALIQHTVWNTAESRHDHGPLRDLEADLAICAWARLDNRDELAPHLGLNAADVSTSDIAFLLAAYRKWGEDCVLHLLGDFAFAVWNGRRQTLFCARDPMGVRPFYYHLSADRLLFTTSLKVFVGLDGFPLEPVQRWMAEYLLGLSMSFDATAYRDVLKLPPGHCLSVGREGHALRQYHRLRGETTLRLKRSEEYVEAYREEMERAIRRRLRSVYPMGSELSGGIDSSTLTAFAARLLPRPRETLHAFAFVTHEQEREYIDEVIRATPLAATHVFAGYEVPQEEREAHMARTLDILGYPMEHDNSTGHEPFYRKAEGLGMRTLLSGFGGDEFVTNPASLAMDELLHRKRYLQLYRNLSGNAAIRALRMAKRVLLPRERATNPRFEEAFRRRWALQPVREQYVEAFDLERRHMANARFDAGWDTLNDFVLQNRWAPFVPTRLENCSLMAAARRIEYRWPLLDARLVQLFLSIPVEEKHSRGVGRLLHRRAIDGVVPRKVAWKMGKSMGEPLPAGGFADSPSLREPLHPQLLDLVNGDRLRASGAVPDEATRQGLARYRVRAAWLDLWLAGASAIGMSGLHPVGLHFVGSGQSIGSVPTSTRIPACP